VPGNTTTLNQVWQVGGAVNGTRPSIHPLETENKESKSKLTLASSPSTSPIPAPAPAPHPSDAAPMFRWGGLGLISGLALLVGSAILS
ncbi:hypothetical protein CRG98_049844, partial [Punica granatum]